MNNATTTNKTYQLILTAIKSGKCDLWAVLTTIDTAFENGHITFRESRLLTAALGLRG